MDDLWARIYEAMLQRHFRQANSTEYGYVAFDGELTVRGNKVPVRVTFLDSELQSMPILQLLERPKWLPRLCAHISPAPGFELCYPGRTTDILDRYIAHQQILGILDAAESQLRELHDNGALDDVIAEFGHYWHGSVLLLDDVGTGPKDEIAYGQLTSERGGGVLLTPLTNKPHFDATHLVDLASWAKASAYFVQLDGLPKIGPEQAWPPSTLGDIRDWFAAASPTALAGLRKALGWMHSKQSRKGIVIFKSDQVWFGIGIDLKNMYLDPGKIRKKDDFVKYALGNLGSNEAIERYLASRIDADFLVNRNLPKNMGSLEGKKILLVGCGTIGGFLGDALVRVGAGTSNGLLHLIDKQTFSAGNLGRHRLTFSAIGLRKAYALADELRRVNPFSNIHPTSGSVLDLSSLNEYDIIIDATGHDPLSQKLNALYLNGTIQRIIFCWVVGNGTAAQVLICNNKTKACLRCLTSTQDPESFIPVSPDNVIINMGRGCDAPYIPFSVQPSLAAATLGVGAVLDALSSKPGYNFRTTMLDQKAHQIKWKTVKKIKHCPACSQ